MCNGGKHYVEIAARVNPSTMEMPNGPLCLSPEQQSRSLRDLCDSVFPIGFPSRVSNPFSQPVFPCEISCFRNVPDQVKTPNSTWPKHDPTDSMRVVRGVVDGSKELIDQPARCFNDMLWTGKPSVFDIGNVVFKTSDTLCLNRLFHSEKIAILLGMAWIRRSVIPQDVLGEHELNIATAPSPDRRGHQPSATGDLLQ